MDKKREIKFRGKSIDGVNWLTGSYVQFKGKDYIQPYEIFAIYEVLPGTVGQYTGLSYQDGDENKPSRDVWEGDVFDYGTDGNEALGVVIWNNPHSAWDIEMLYPKAGFEDFEFLPKARPRYVGHISEIKTKHEFKESDFTE